MKRREFLATGLSMAGAFAMRSAYGQPAPSNRAAVVIGVDKVGSFQPLRAARSGAIAVADWLKGEGFEVALLVDDPNPVRTGDLKAAIKTFVNRGTLDQLVIYFAGHGVVNAFNTEFWLLSGAPDDLDEAVSLKESRDIGRNFGIRNVVFISDACRSQADSLRIGAIHGSVVFPNPGNTPVGRCDVDTFLATRIGLPAWEVPVATSTANYQGVYTSCFLEAFQRPYASMVHMLDGKPVVPSRRLRDYLEQEVPRKARAVSITLRQDPDAEICSDEPRYIGHVSTATRVTNSGSSEPTLSDVATRAIGTEVGGGRPQHSDAALQRVATASGFNAASDNISLARGLSNELSARSGFVISGARLVSVTARPGIKTGFVNSPAASSPSALVEVDVRAAHATSVALRFDDGSGTVLAALDEFLGNVVVDEGAVTSVSLVPSQQNWRRSAFESEGKRIEQLHAAVATAARFGVFRIEGPAGTRERTSAQLASTIRMLKGIDPTLGLYAAYAYDDAGVSDQVRSVRGIMRGDLGVDLFDVAMLTGDLSGRTLGGPGGPYPFCPMLSQGFGLLRVRNVRLPSAVAPAADHLRRSLWTTFDREGMQIVIDALSAGRVS